MWICGNVCYRRKNHTRWNLSGWKAMTAMRWTNGAIIWQPLRRMETICWWTRGSHKIRWWDSSERLLYSDHLSEHLFYDRDPAVHQKSNTLTEGRKKVFYWLFNAIIIAAFCEWLGNDLQGRGPSTRLLHITVKAVELTVAPSIAFVSTIPMDMLSGIKFWKP